MHVKTADKNDKVLTVSSFKHASSLKHSVASDAAKARAGAGAYQNYMCTKAA